MKKDNPFCWTEKHEQAFQRLKAQLTNAPILALQNFSKTFELECDASGVGICVVLLQGGHPIAYFSEKLHGVALNYPTYDKELYAKWMEFLEQFPYVIKYKKGSTNIVADALSRRHALFTKLGAQILGFENIPELYKEDHDFAPTFVECQHKAQGGFYVSEGYIFKEGKLCIPQETHRKLLVKEAYEGGLMGHFGVDKTLELLKRKFFWTHMRKDVQRHCRRCISCLKGKSKTMPHELYTHLPCASAPWKDISMNFILSSSLKKW